MKPAGYVMVSGTRGNLTYRYPERGRVSFICIQDEMLDVIVENIPRLARREQRRALGNFVNTHVPECPEEYQMDFLVRPEPQKRMRAIIILIRKEVMDEIREIHPWLPIINFRSIELLNGQSVNPDQNVPVSRYELFRPPRFRPIDRIMAILVVLLLVSGGLNIWARYIRTESQREVDNTSTALSKVEKDEILSLENNIEQLEDELNTLIITRPQKINQMLQSLLEVSKDRLEIQHIIINGRYFKVRGLSASPLLIALALNDSHIFRNTAISDIRPDKTGTRKTFSLEGLYIGY